METRSSSVLHPPAPPIEAACPHFGVCGGCSRQDLSYADQLRLKEKHVLDSLQAFPVGRHHAIVPSAETFYYRNKMEFSFGDNFDRTELRLAEQPGVHVGLHPKGRFSLTVPTPDCRLISEDAMKITAVVEHWASKNSTPVYVRSKNEGVLRHLVIREGKNTGERLVNLITTSKLTDLQGLDSALRVSGAAITTLIWTIHDGLSDVARGDEQRVIWGDGSIQEKIGDLSIRVTPRTFMQTNTRAAEGLIKYLKHLAGVGDTLLDLYCGTGVLGLSLAGHFIQVKGVEIEAASVASARETAERNGVINFSAQQGSMEKFLSIFEDNRGRVDVCLVDPPRAGLHPEVTKALAASGVPMILYVSCNPFSLARDLSGLVSKYTIDEVQPMDFFPHTDHVETVVKLTLR
jgi:23S rRNA (uracil1939-C5)-methyltransferase